MNPSKSRTRSREITAIVLTVLGMVVPLVASITESSVDPEARQAVMVGGLAAMWMLAVAVFALLRRPTSLGGVVPARFTWSDLGIAVAVGVVGALLVPVLTLAVTALLGDTDLAATASRVPVLLLLASILTAAVTEEVLYRAAPIELLLQRRTPTWVAFAAPWAAFVIAHAGSWNLAHIVGVVAPLGALLTGLYLWRRNLLVNIVAHAIIDAPLIALALAGG